MKLGMLIDYSKKIATYFSASLIPMLLNLAINPLIAQNMSPADYAITGYYTSFTSLIGPIIVFYMIHYYIKDYYRCNEDERKTLFATIAKALIWFSGLVAIICFFCILIYLKYINIHFSLPISPYLALSVFALPLTGLLNLHLAKFRMEKKASAFFKLSVSNGILIVILSFTMVVIAKMGALGKLIAVFSSNLIVFLLLLIYCRDNLKIKITLREFKKIFIFCLPLALSAMLGYFTNGFTTTYLESLGDVTEYGIYIVGIGIGGYLSTASTAIWNTFQPDIYESIIKRDWRRWLKFAGLQIVIIAAVVMLFIVLAPFIIDILTAGRYVASTKYAQIIALTSITSSIYYLTNDMTIATNHPRLYLYTSIIGSIIIVCTLPIIVKAYAFEGGCWMSVISFIVFALINITLLKLNSLRNESPMDH